MGLSMVANIAGYLLVFLTLSRGQVLQTKCPSNEWHKYKERCYLVVNFQHSWAKANNYCQKYGAKLVEAPGYVLTDEISGLVSNALPSATHFWTGYNILNKPSSAGGHVGKWSDGEETAVHVGVWGHNEPRTDIGQCAAVSLADNLWYMSRCMDVRPFVCELDPCPAGSRDTFMCNGRCLSHSRKCDGVDNCGDGSDEIDCPRQCHYSYTSRTGEITLDTVSRMYRNNQSCVWTITTPASTRINVQFVYFDTEENTDFLELWDGGMTLSASRLAARYSGTTNTPTSYTSSYNFLQLRFVSDAAVGHLGFKLNWTTTYTCSYNMVDGYNYSNTEIATGEVTRLSTLFTEDKCKEECNVNPACYGFSYNKTSRTCFYIRLMPLLQMATNFKLYTKTCTPGSQVIGSVPLQSTQLMASDVPGQIFTPLYPNPYIGNMEVEYTITVHGNNLIMIEVVYLDLCCEDSIMIYDSDHDLLETLTNQSMPGTVLLSTGNMVYVRLDLVTHLKCRGAVLQYTRGCSMLNSGSGVIASPGYASGKGYPHLTTCEWTVNAPSTDRSVTIRFDSFDLHSTDSLQLTYSNGTSVNYTDSSLHGMSLTSDSFFTVTMVTSAVENRRGFSASFSPGCPTISGNGYVVSSQSFNFGDTITVSCGTGFYFTDDYRGQDTVTLTCESGGHWSLSPVPKCAPADCVNVTEVVKNVDHIRLMNGDGVKHGSVAMLLCSEYEEIWGPEMIQCNQGQWDYLPGDPPKCRPYECVTQMVEHGFLSPAAPYVENQTITVTCAEGYSLKGQASYRCDVDIPPTCEKVTCLLSGLPGIEAADGSTQDIYNYGDEVGVTCGYMFELDQVDTTVMNISCLHTGKWSHVPTCSKLSCGLPYQVIGSEYSPSVPCLDFNCSFTFSCRSKYELLGASVSTQDTVVRCGGFSDGLWDFGDLRCLGGQCRDPGYPASGRLIGDSFLEGSKVTFACNKPGFEPREPGKNYSLGLTCQYSDFPKSMEWIGIMPDCVDVEPPVIHNCNNREVIRTIDNLEPSSYPEPTATDNNAVKEWTVNPENFRPTQVINEAVTVYYTATDFAGNSANCVVRVRIPKSIECNNEITTNLPWLGVTAITPTSSTYVTRLQGGVNVTSVPEVIQVQPEAATLNTAYEATITSLNSSGSVLDTCTLQFRFQPPTTCQNWTLYAPNSGRTCTQTASNFYCDVYCLVGYAFIEEPRTSVIRVSCNMGVWDRDPPVCARMIENYVRYVANLNYKYMIQNGVSDPVACTEAYEAPIISKLQSFSSVMEARCNQLDGSNPVNLTLLTENVKLQFNQGTSRLTVDFTFVVGVQNESATNASMTKQNCVNVVTNSLNLRQNIDTINTLDAIATPSCGNGTYDLPSSTPSYHNECMGFRRYALVMSTAVCLDCPLGYYLVADVNTATYSCEKCPAGTYGYMNNEGAACMPCPGNLNPGLVGQTSIDSCNIKGVCPAGEFSNDGLSPCTKCPKNYFNADPAAHTCRPCATTEVTLETGGTSTADCKDLQDVNALASTDPVLVLESPCHNNPCQNGGNCTYLRNDYFCVCPPDWTGSLCERRFDKCVSNPCQNDQPCHVDANSTEGFICACNINPSNRNEFNGTYCENDRIGCDSSFCNNNGTCHNQLGNHRCICPGNSGFTNHDGTCKTQMDPCVVSPCEQGTCVPHGQFYKSCDCFPGYTGIYCQTNINDCAASLCMNGATCVDGNNTFQCQCPPNFHGLYCQHQRACNVQCGAAGQSNCHTCVMDNTDKCVDFADSYVCDCKPGFSGLSCQIEESPCNEVPCEHNGVCEEISDTDYQCLCPHPWTGKNCDSQINYCPINKMCFNGGQCFSTASGYSCSCPGDFIGYNCSEPYNLCDRASVCIGVTSNCSVSSGGQFECACDVDRSGANCQMLLTSCDDIVCENGGTCSMATDGVRCSCAPGFTGLRCETNINECVSHQCSTTQVCEDRVNGYQCVCTAGKRGQNCNKDVGRDFDYVIRPMTPCGGDAQVAMFGDGQTDINDLSIAFWVRYTVANQNAVIMNIFGSQSGSETVPASPDFHFRFTTSGVRAFVRTVAAGRRKRQTEELLYNTVIMDGFWHHLTVTWSITIKELTLYVDGTANDQTVFSENQAIGNRGFLVFGDYDPGMGTSSLASSFEGRISQLFVTQSLLTADVVVNLYTRSTVPNDIQLHQERNLMLMYPVDYNSELAINQESCLPGDTNCPGLNPAASLPQVTSCPGDTLVVTARTAAPNWTEPTFSGTTISPPISNVQSGAANLDWGIHGIAYAVFDGFSNAALCTFRLYNRGLDCQYEPAWQCDVTSTAGVVQCATGDRCPSGQQVPGTFPDYLTCSMYSMWDEAVKQEEFIFPSCAVAEALTMNLRLDIELTYSKPCSTNSSLYREVINSILTGLNTLNTNVSYQLCMTGGSSCINPVYTSGRHSCVGPNTLAMSLNFGLVGSPLIYNGQQYTPEEVLRLAVGDLMLFDYTDPQDSTRNVRADRRSLSVTDDPQCAPGYMVSGDKCVQCGMGTYYESSSRTCRRCPIGSYRNDISNVTSACTNCHVSSTTYSEGATDPVYCLVRCLAGQYYDNVGARSCVPCAVGFYQERAGQFTCEPCSADKTTADVGSSLATDCVAPQSLTTTPTQGPPPDTGAATEGSSLDTGVIVAIVLGIVILVTIIILIICFCCCKEIMPCFSKSKKTVGPVQKEGYFANKYGEPNMSFVSYNLQDVREKKGKPMDRLPFVDHPLSAEETGSVKTDISVHVPVFHEKMDGNVYRKNLFVQNGGSHSLSLPPSARSGRHLRDPVMTSSPRATGYDIDEQEAYVKPRRKKRKDKSRKRRSRHHDDMEDDTMAMSAPQPSGPLPKALAPMPQKLKSVPPANANLRPSSALEQRRPEVLPSQYEDFLTSSPQRTRKSHHDRSRSPEEVNRSRSYDDDLQRSHDEGRRSRDGERRSKSRDGHRSRSHKKKSRGHRHGNEEDHYSGGYYDNVEVPQSSTIRRIEVESSEDDLR